ncbi:MAG: 50S ribosomal protein L10 [Bdellovibrionales bacterium]
MLSRAQKENVIAGISDKIERSAAAFLVDFKGMNVEQVTDLRKKLTAVEAEMLVVRNTLAKRALAKFPKDEEAISADFTGTNALVFAFGDASAPAKTLSEFSKDVEHLELKSGVMEGERLDEARIKYLADLPPQEVLQAQFLGVLAAPASKFVRTLSAVPGGFARVLKAYEEKQA